MSIGYITDAYAKQYILELFRTDRGAVEDVSLIEEEELIAAGVDGRRFRTVGNRYRPFTATILQTCLNYPSAITTARAYDDMIGTIVKLNITLTGVTYNYPRVHVRDARVRCMPGAVAGSTNAATHAAYVTGELDLVLIEAVPGATP
jgi:hypothetical protein